MRPRNDITHFLLSNHRNVPAVISLTPAPRTKAWPELFSITRGLWIYNNHHQALTADIKDANYQKLVQIEAELHQAHNN